MRVVTKAMAADYIYYAFYNKIELSSFVQISVHLKGKKFLLFWFQLESVQYNPMFRAIIYI